MIEFLNPLLLAGLAAVSAPVIIHLLHRRIKQVDWGAMRFLLEMLAKRRRRLFLDELAAPASLTIANGYDMLSGKCGNIEQNDKKNYESTTNTSARSTGFLIQKVLKESQEGNTSLERQAKAALEVCQRMGWKLVDLPPDKGLSGSKQVKDKDGNMVSLNKARGNLGAFLARVKAGEVPTGSRLLIDDAARFSRNNDAIEVLNDINSLLKKGIGLYSCLITGNC